MPRRRSGKAGRELDIRQKQKRNTKQTVPDGLLFCADAVEFRFVGVIL
jgi:hypothetical protein